MKSIAAVYASVFSDDEWFNKVLIGGIYILLIPALIGIIMIMGFQIEFAKKLSKNETGMPMWRYSRNIFSNGIRAFSVSFFYAALIVALLFSAGVPFFSIAMILALLTAHLVLNPVIIDLFSKSDSITHNINPITVGRTIFKNFRRYLFIVIVTTIMTMTAVLFGWMWIVVGWTLLIFLTLLVQTAMMSTSVLN